jgi:hypothetical protein
VTAKAPVLTFLNKYHYLPNLDGESISLYGSFIYINKFSMKLFFGYKSFRYFSKCFMSLEETKIKLRSLQKLSINALAAAVFIRFYLTEGGYIC